MPLALAPGSYASKVYSFNQRLVLPKSDSRTGVRTTYPINGKQTSSTCVSGTGNTVFNFVDTITGGPLISNEGYGDVNVDTDTNLTPKLHNLIINGNAQINPFPWDYANSPNGTGPDLHGPDTINRTDGLAIDGSGFIGTWLRFVQIPGTALIAKQGRDVGQGVYGWAQPSLDWIFARDVINGVDCPVGDARLNHIYITNVVKDALIIGGSGTRVFDAHTWGADRACVVSAPAFFRDSYFEAARIGTDVLSTAYGAEFNGHIIGPGTCWERAVRIGAHGTKLRGLYGTVRLQTVDHPSIVGVEILTGLSRVVVQGSLDVAYDAALPNAVTTGITMTNSTQHKIDLTDAGWALPTAATYLNVIGYMKGCRVDITGEGDGGKVVDLTQYTGGKYNTINIIWKGSTTQVVNSAAFTAEPTNVLTTTPANGW